MLRDSLGMEFEGLRTYVAYDRSSFVVCYPEKPDKDPCKYGGDQGPYWNLADKAAMGCLLIEKTLRRVHY